jgi:hypothetical protein
MVIKDTLNQPRHLMEMQKQPKKMRIETPLGNIESDSGNHYVDVASVVIVMGIFFMMRKFFKAT